MRGSKHFFVKYMAPLVALALCGCSKLAVHQLEAGRTGSLEIVVENFAPGLLRTIAPGPVTAADLQNSYTLKLTGTSGRKTLPERAVTLANGQATVDGIPMGLWELTLTAYNSNGVAVLQGKAIHQVRQVGGGNVSFLLSPVAAGTGTVNVTVNFNAADIALVNVGGARDVRIELLRRGEGTPAPGTTAAQFTGAQIVPGSWRYTGAASNATSPAVEAGEYDLRVSYSGGGLPAGTTLTWSNNLYVEAGRETAATVTIPQLAHLPSAPGGFSCVNHTPGQCEGTLSWDSVYNTDGYEVQLRTFTEGTWRQFDEAAWNGLAGGATHTYTAAAWSPDGAPVYKEGSLKKGSGHFGVTMGGTAGPFWTARMRAVNGDGESGWTYLPCPSPSNPHRKDKATTNFTVASTGGSTTGSGVQSITGTQRFNPYGEGLWVYAANWDGGENKFTVGAGGNKGSTIGNEVLLVDWDPADGADHYELEILLHPNHGLYDEGAEKVSNSAKYDSLPATDAEWNSFAGRAGVLQLAFSGDSGSPNYYRTKTYTYNIPTKSATSRVNFEFLAWRPLADGRNGGYKVATGANNNSSFIGAPDGTTGLSTRGNGSYRIGLEGDCDALAVLVNSFSPQHWYGIRLRAVNEHGTSDWVYWKGGKN